MTQITYEVHVKEGSEDSMRVEYWAGVSVVAREWVCFDHTGYPRMKAEKWWRMRHKAEGIPRNSAEAVAATRAGAILQPEGITITREKRPEILAYRWARRNEEAAA